MIIMAAVEEDPHATLSDLEKQTGISKTTIFRILRDNPQYRNVSCYWVPKFLTEHQKQQRLDRATGIRERLLNLGEKRYDVYAVEDETWFRFGVEYTKKRARVWKPFEKERPQIPASNLTLKSVSS